jgi:hypothetical protein
MIVFVSEQLDHQLKSPRISAISASKLQRRGSGCAN